MLTPCFLTYYIVNNRYKSTQRKILIQKNPLIFLFGPSKVLVNEWKTWTKCTREEPSFVCGAADTISFSKLKPDMQLVVGEEWMFENN